MAEVVFNAASLRTPLGDRADVLATMSRFLVMLARAPGEGYERAMRIPPEFFQLELAPGFRIMDWLETGEVRSDEKRLLRERATRSPFLEGVAEAVQAVAPGIAVLVHNVEEEAFRAAYLLDAALMSLDVPPWDRPYLDGICQRFDEAQADAELISQPVSLRNLAQAEHYKTHAAWVTQRRRALAFDLPELWKQRDTLLDRLVFCPAVEKQLHRRDIVLENRDTIRSRLFELQDYCERWQEGGFDRGAFSVRCDPTSPKTLQDYGRSYYTFPVEEHKWVLCGWHLRLAANAWRIYFSPDPESRRIIVGHIGEHLPTATQFT